MTREELEACWQDPENRKWGVYYSHADPLVIVQKHSKLMGSTINFASPSAIPVVLLTFAILVVPVLFVRTWDARIGAVLATILISTAVLCLLCAYLSSTKRSTH
ncbi:MAG: hypothetical protein DME76_05995 [Verrucomicrobia bacterium]|nr:MAG: hypothetical protein DME76_05995 [Verrucomicrobiota bacterium]